MRRLWVFVLFAALLGAAGHFEAETHVLSAAPDLTVAVTASILRDGADLPEARRVAPGDHVRYEMRIENVGGGDAYGVVLQIAMPEGFAYREGSTSAAWSTGRSTADPTQESDRNLQFRVDAALPAGAVLTLAFETLVTSDVDEIGPYVGVAIATGVDADGARIPAERSADLPGEDAPKNVDEAVLLPSRPALVTATGIAAITREGEEIPATGPIEPGDVVTYHLTVENVGRGTAYNVAVEDQLPPSLAYVVGSTAAHWPAGRSSEDPAGAPGASLSWPLSAVLRFGEVLALRFDAVVGSALKDSPCINVMAASGNDADGGPTPPDRAHEIPADIDADDSSVAILSSTLPALSVNKEIIDVHRHGVSVGVVSSAVPGDVVTYRFTIRNVGNATAYNVDFQDQLPSGFEYETGSAYGEGLYVVSSPHKVGPLSVPDGGGSFVTAVNATIHAEAQLVATYTARVTDAATLGVSLESTAEAEGFSSSGVEISDSNPAIGDTRDDDADDEDADDTGSAAIRLGMPALAVEKQTVDIERLGASVGAASAAEPGDVVVSRFTIRNVGTDTAYDVGFTDLLPPGLEIDTVSGAGTFSVDLPPAGPMTLSFDNGAPGAVHAILGARIDRGGTLTAIYRIRVTSEVAQSRPLVHETRAVGRDAAGVPIPPANPAVLDTSDDDENDRDADDVGAEVVPIAESALAVKATVFAIVRDGASVALPDAARPGDVVTFQVRVSNVGRGTAYDVSVEGSLPADLAYAGPSSAAWPGGSSRVDPLRGPDASLAWDPKATLGGGDDLVLSFDVHVRDEARRNTSLLFVARACGVDGNGSPIPADNSEDVPADADGDDVDTARLAVVSDGTTPAITALATELCMTRIVRNGATVFGPVVESGDRVTFEWVIRNVGHGTVYDVVSIGETAPGMRYAPGSTLLRWPFGVSFADPSGALGAALEWSSPAPLQTGESIRLEFDLMVAERLPDGRSAILRIEVHGHEATGAPILTDQSRTIARDSDIDDAASWSLSMRSSSLPETGLWLNPAPDRSLVPTSDRLRFQTDMALYAAAELGGLAEEIENLRSLPRIQIPACFRTLAAEAEGVAFENLVEVEVGSGMGVPLSAGPWFRDAENPEAALEQALCEIACAVGLDAAERPAAERWILLEYAAGDPRFATRVEEGNAWPTGEWATYDRRVTPGAVGMGLLAQATAAQRLLESPHARDRYLGGVLVLAMRNKVASLAELRGAPGSSNGLLAHAYTVVWRDSPGIYTVVEPRTELVDQLALMWGLAAFVEFAERMPSSWPPALGSLAGDASRARQELDRILRGIRDSLRGFDGALRESTADASDHRARTTTLGLLLAALHRVSSIVGPDPALERLATHAAIQLSARVGLDGRLVSAGTETVFADAPAVVRGLLAASRILGVSAYEAVAVRVLEAFDQDSWESTLGVYVGPPHEPCARRCVTPLDLGLLVGALRDASAVLPPTEAARILPRLASHIRVLIRGAALHLATARPYDESESLLGSGAESLAPAGVADAPLGWAFVFRDRVCYSPRRP
ncbi:MAG: hypothetical protein AB7V19_02780 [Candidatus Bipolaricaulia bacterium]